jgi:hypothetical protein
VCVCLSKFDEIRKRTLALQLREVGLDVEEEFNDSVTHVVSQTPSRSIKYLQGCAAGAWV